MSYYIAANNTSSDVFVSSAVTNLFHRQEILLPGANQCMHIFNHNTISVQTGLTVQNYFVRKKMFQYKVLIGKLKIICDVIFLIKLSLFYKLMLNKRFIRKHSAIYLLYLN